VKFEKGTGTDPQFNATAKEYVAIYNSAIEHSKVAIAANTVVLKDVTFAGNDVTLKSQTGFVAAYPGTGRAVSPGQINFVSGVYYNSHEVSLPAMANPEGHVKFHELAVSAGKNFNGLKIQNLEGLQTVRTP
jgi:hypothetical protein